MWKLGDISYIFSLGLASIHITLLNSQNRENSLFSLAFLDPNAEKDAILFQYVSHFEPVTMMWRNRTDTLEKKLYSFVHSRGMSFKYRFCIFFQEYRYFWGIFVYWHSMRIIVYWIISRGIPACYIIQPAMRAVERC